MKKFANLTINGASVSISNDLTTDLFSLVGDKNILSVLKQHLPKLWEREIYPFDSNNSDIRPVADVVPDEYLDGDVYDDCHTVDGLMCGYAQDEHGTYVLQSTESYNESPAFGGYSIHQGWKLVGNHYVPFFSASSRAGGWSVNVTRVVAEPLIAPFKHCGKCDYDGDSCHGVPLWDDEA